MLSKTNLKGKVDKLNLKLYDFSAMSIEQQEVRGNLLIDEDIQIILKDLHALVIQNGEWEAIVENYGHQLVSTANNFDYIANLLVRHNKFSRQTYDEESPLMNVFTKEAINRFEFLHGYLLERYPEIREIYVSNKTS